MSDSESEASGRVIYLLQKSLEEVVAERDKLKAVCQPIYEQYREEVELNITGFGKLNKQLLDICKVMRKYNR